MTRLELILFTLVFTSVILCSDGSSCHFEVFSSNGEQLPTAGCPTVSDAPEWLSRRRTGSVSVDDVRARWHAMPRDRDSLLLNVTMTTRGTGDVEVDMLAHTQVFPMFCGTFTPSANETDQVNVQVKCLQEALVLGLQMSLVVSPFSPFNLNTRRSRRNSPAKVNIELPGCTLPEFQRTKLCKASQEPRKIKFKLRHEGTKSAPMVRAIMPKSLYKSKHESRKQARARRYFVAIKERGTDRSGWFSNPILQLSELRWPKRRANFKHLQPGTTYVVMAWREGDSKRYKKEITLCT